MTFANDAIRANDSSNRYFVKPLLTVVLVELPPTRDSCPGGNCQNPLPYPRGSFARWGRRKDVHDLLLQRHGIILEHPHDAIGAYVAPIGWCGTMSR